MRPLSIVFGISLLVLILIGSIPSIAHQLSVFAWVEGNSVLVEACLPKGKHPKLGDVLVYDGEDQLLLKTRLLPDGTSSFPWKTGKRVFASSWISATGIEPTGF